MGKLGAFTISFNNPDRVYKPGDQLTGHVYVHLRENMKMRGILISFKGNSQVKFSKRRNKTTHYYKAKEDYFDEAFPLFKPQGNSEHLHQGEHRFDFQYQLPPFLPSTIEHETGYVRYYIKCRIDRPWKFDHTVKEAFTVVGILDLNVEQGVELPQHLEQKEDSHNCCCMKDGDGSLKVDLPRTGYVPGESIPITAELINNVPETLTFTVELIQYVEYSAQGHKKDVREVISELGMVRVDNNKSFTYNRELLHIPAVPPSRLDGCNSIDIMYSLKLKATTGWFELKVKFPIIIGTVPLRSVVDAYRMPPLPDLNAITLEPSAPQFPAPVSFPMAPSAPPSASNFEIPPPSYAECMSGNINIRDDEDSKYTFGEANYTPKYTYYQWT